MKTKLKSINEIQSAVQAEVKTPFSLAPEVIKMLIERIGDEYTAHYFYRNASNWCTDKAYNKAAAYFAAEAANELEHAEKLQAYLVGWNAMPIIPPVNMVPQFIHLIDIVNKAYDLEYQLLKSYNLNSSQVFGFDLNTFDFLQEFRIIQNGSVAEYADLLNAAQLINVENNFEVLYFENQYFN